MCYDIELLVERITKQGIRLGNTPDEVKQVVEEIVRKIRNNPPVYHTSGFDHPLLPLIVQKDGKLEVMIMRWGLIPSWSKDAIQAVEMSNMTICARDASLFEKKSFKIPMQNGQRALLPLTAYYEFFTYEGNDKRYRDKKYPHHVSMDDYFFVACVFDRWNEELSFSIVTTDANPLMAKIHNRPAKSETPRMPLILEGQNLVTWLNPSTDENTLKSLMKPYPEDHMKAHTVAPLRGKDRIGNRPEASQYIHYPELDGDEQLSLF